MTTDYVIRFAIFVESEMELEVVLACKSSIIAIIQLATVSR